jgi:hypothetical protein
VAAIRVAKERDHRVGLASAGNTLYAAAYFSDSVVVVELAP